MITDVAGVRVGHWADHDARTGCTAVVFPAGTIAAGEVRGGAPGTREFALLEPGRLVDRLDAVVLAGGSAFGLAACDGAMQWCEERGMGFPTGAGPVPIVVGMVIYDLAVGDASVRPGRDQGYSACVSAAELTSLDRSAGAGAGATAAKWWGVDHRRDGGIGSASVRADDLVVAAVVVANPLGDLRARAAKRPLAGGSGFSVGGQESSVHENTTIGVVATNARLDKVGCHLVAQSAHDGLARALEPAHLRGDGDAFVAAATGEVEAPVDLVRIMAARAVEASIEAALAE